MKAEKKAVIAVSVPEDVKNAIRKLAKDKGVPTSTYVRMLVAQDLIKHGLR
jgi:predicted DNA binding CopG/RHH family protein